MLLFPLTCLILNVLHSSEAYIDRSSEEAEQKDKDPIKFLNLPQEYYCCKGNGTLQNRDWIVSCIDENKVTANVSIDCHTPHFFEAYSPGGLDFTVEDDVVYYGTSDYGIEMKSKDSCFANETTQGNPRLMVIMCLNAEEDVPEEVKEKAPIAGALSLVSTPFSILVIIVYASVPKLRGLQGESILSLCCSFLISSLIIANENLQVLKVTRDCHAGGDILFFTLMASVFWMNSIIIQTFTTVRFPNISTPWRKQFVWYSCYGWGFPSFLWLLAMINDVTPGSLVLNSMDMTFNCLNYYDDRDEWLYYLGPMTAAIVLSGVLLLYSAILTWKQLGEPQFKPLRYNFMLTLKLFAVVGISWLNEPFQKLHGEESIMWLFGDCWNLLQGFLLFIVLVLLRKRAMRGILDKYSFIATTWLRRYTDRLSDDDSVEIIVEENGLFDVNIQHNDTENK